MDAPAARAYQVRRLKSKSEVATLLIRGGTVVTMNDRFDIGLLDPFQLQRKVVLSHLVSHFDGYGPAQSPAAIIEFPDAEATVAIEDKMHALARSIAAASETGATDTGYYRRPRSGAEKPRPVPRPRFDPLP